MKVTFYIVPLSVAQEEVLIMLFERASIKHTGDVRYEKTKEKLDWI
jgi:hypothetical protein